MTRRSLRAKKVPLPTLRLFLELLLLLVRLLVLLLLLVRLLVRPLLLLLLLRLRLRLLLDADHCGSRKLCHLWVFQGWVSSRTRAS